MTGGEIAACGTPPALFNSNSAPNVNSGDGRRFALAIARGLKESVQALLLKTGGHFAFADIYKAAARAEAVSLQAIHGDPAALEELRALASEIESLIPKLPPQGPEEILPPIISTLTIEIGHGGLIGVPAAPCQRPECVDYTGFAKEARRRGHNVTVINGTITFDKLNSTDVFMVPPPVTPFSSDELNAIQQYVEAGGGLFVIGFDPDFKALWNVSQDLPVNNLSSPFGVIYRAGQIEQFNGVSFSTTVSYTNLTPHRTTEGVSEVKSYNGSDLITLFGAEPIVTGNGSSTRVRLFNGTDPPGPVLAAASGLGNGSAFFVSDLHLFDDGDRDDDGAPDLDAGSNRQFALNILEFLRPGASTVGTVRVPAIPEGFGVEVVSVADARGSPLSGLHVDAKNKSTNETFSCITNDAGFCTLTLLEGVYTLQAHGSSPESVLKDVGVTPSRIGFDFLSALTSEPITCQGGVDRAFQGGIGGLIGFGTLGLGLLIAIPAALAANPGGFIAGGSLASFGFGTIIASAITSGTGLAIIFAKCGK
ncbi:MAG: DUF4350 domain-containing protein [Halobacteria archaeon]